MTRSINFLLYQTGWFACVLGASRSPPGLGVCLALGLIGVHLWLARDVRSQLQLIFAAALFGLLLDSAQLWAGVFSFPGERMIQWLPPPFMTVLWMQFATTFRYSLSWLSGRYALCSLFGLIGAPLAFFAGEKLGAIEFLVPRWPHFAILGLIWSAAVPLLFLLTDRLAVAAAAPEYRWPLRK